VLDVDVLDVDVLDGDVLDGDVLDGDVPVAATAMPAPPTSAAANARPASPHVTPFRFSFISLGFLSRSDTHRCLPPSMRTAHEAMPSSFMKIR